MKSILRFRERENKSDDNQSSSGSRERLWCDDDEELRLDKDDDGARSSTSSSANNRQQRSNGGERKKDAAADSIERDPVVLARRQKQIDYGKNTVSYDNYTDKVPKAKRQPGMPRTPPKHRKFSRRQWDGLIKHWKIRIHEWNVSENGISPEEEVSLKHAGAKRSHELPEPVPAVLTPVQDDVEPPKRRKLSPSDLLRPMD